MKNLLFLFVLCMGFQSYAQEVTLIPDPEFEQLLIDMGIDTDGEVNGQVWTADVDGLTELVLDAVEYEIYDLTGIEDFVSLEYFVLHWTWIGELDVSTMPHLKHLVVFENDLTHIDVSQNPELRYLDISSGGDYGPINEIAAIDLSQNPLIDTLAATGGFIREVNLRNGNNHPDMVLNFSLNGPTNGPIETWNTVCIEVDNPEAAQEGLFPYSEWTIIQGGMLYQFTEDAAACTLGIDKNVFSEIRIYPNPTDGKVNLVLDGKSVTAEVYDLNGRLLKQKTLNEDSVIQDYIDLTEFEKGIYFIRLSNGKETEVLKVLKK